MEIRTQITLEFTANELIEMIAKKTNRHVSIMDIKKSGDRIIVIAEEGDGKVSPLIMKEAKPAKSKKVRRARIQHPNSAATRLYKNLPDGIFRRAIAVEAGLKCTPVVESVDVLLKQLVSEGKLLRPSVGTYKRKKATQALWQNRGLSQFIREQFSEGHLIPLDKLLLDVVAAGYKIKTPIDLKLQYLKNGLKNDIIEATPDVFQSASAYYNRDIVHHERA